MTGCTWEERFGGICQQYSCIHKTILLPSKQLCIYRRVKHLKEIKKEDINKLWWIFKEFLNKAALEYIFTTKKVKRR